MIANKCDVTYFRFLATLVYSAGTYIDICKIIIIIRSIFHCLLNLFYKKNLGEERALCLVTIVYYCFNVSVVRVLAYIRRKILFTLYKQVGDIEQGLLEYYKKSILIKLPRLYNYVINKAVSFTIEVISAFKELYKSRIIKPIISEIQIFVLCYSN
jgi:hypothetical protein